MANQYREMSRKHQEEVNNFPMKFAFGDKQFENMMAEWNLTMNDLDKIVSTGYGGYMLKSDVESYKAMGKRHSEELKQAIENDKTGDGFIYDMFIYELANHEYGCTGEVEDTLEALGMTLEEINENPVMKKALEKACSKFM